MYTHAKKRKDVYDHNIALREYKSSANKRVIKGTETFNQYDLKSQIACLPGSKIRESPIVKTKKSALGRTSDTYMNEHMWNKDIFASDSLGDNNKQYLANKENYNKNRNARRGGSGDVSKLLATTPQLEAQGHWKQEKFRKKHEGLYNQSIYKTTTNNYLKSFFQYPKRSFDACGKKRNQDWEKSRCSGFSSTVDLVTAVKGINARSAKVKNDLTGSQFSYH